MATATQTLKPEFTDELLRLIGKQLKTDHCPGARYKEIFKLARAHGIAYETLLELEILPGINESLGTYTGSTNKLRRRTSTRAGDGRTPRG